MVKRRRNKEVHETYHAGGIIYVININISNRSREGTKISRTIPMLFEGASHSSDSFYSRGGASSFSDVCRLGGQLHPGKIIPNPKFSRSDPSSDPRRADSKLSSFSKNIRRKLSHSLPFSRVKNVSRLTARSKSMRSSISWKTEGRGVENVALRVSLLSFSFFSFYGTPLKV